MVKPTKRQIIKCCIALAIWLVFILWIHSLLGLIAVPFIIDAYITKFIPWSWWRKSKNKHVVSIMSWVDAIIFALVAVYFVNLYFFQNYVIPTSSLEKSLLVGDYLFVSKMSYGPRTPQTPLHMPLTSHTIPVLNCKSFIEHPQWGYKRSAGFGNVKLNDIVVFNFPVGDSLATKVPAEGLYLMAYPIGKEISQPVDMTNMTAEQKRTVYNFYYEFGKKYIEDNSTMYGEIISRPVDMRENYVKRCVGLPGQTLQIKNRIIYLNGKENKEPDNVQYEYLVHVKAPIPDELAQELGISREDLSYFYSKESVYDMPLTKKAKAGLLARKDIVVSIDDPVETTNSDWLYPLNKETGWTRDNYGPIWIPKKGATVDLSLENLPYYERPIQIYEGNTLSVKDGKIYINGKETSSYTFKMDYYWMMGDNRHNSQDSRYWGFVPEDHIIGKPIFIWLSLDKDRGWFSGKLRFKRMFTLVDNIK
ncbi:MAG: signal peptidase I [Phocaeicola sp.]|uniref:signal peptidase I n=1 Tax=Phocaeicola sp. TaxID=2773926 RepID=UPI003FA15D7F